MKIKIDIRIKTNFLLKGEIENNNNYITKRPRKKIEIKTIRTKLKNIIPSI
jgi:hypothetical protein